MTDDMYRGPDDGLSRATPAVRSVVAVVVAFIVLLMIEITRTVVIESREPLDPASLVDLTDVRF